MFRLPQEIGVVSDLKETVAHSFMDPEPPLRPATVKDKDSHQVNDHFIYSANQI